jgi:hypothetical protein
MITVLLQNLQPELEDPSTGEELPENSEGSQSTKSREKLTAVTGRILPALRQYSTWLVSRGSDIAIAATDSNNRELNMHIQQMWSIYAEVMTKVASVFPVTDLVAVNYLLTEDETTVGFKPLRDPNIAVETDLYINEEGLMKPRITDQGIERNLPKVEMLARIRDILLCALILITEQKAPVKLENNAFVYAENIHQPPISSPVSQSSLLHVTSKHAHHDITFPRNGPKHDFTSIGNTELSDSLDSMDTDMNRMVDNLVESSAGNRYESNETSYGMHSNTANEIFAPSVVQSPQQSTPKMLPSLPGIWNGPFTPQPHELQQTSPDRPSTARKLSPFQFSTKEQQRAAASSLEEIAGYTKSRSWSRSSRPATNPKLPPVHQSLNESLSQQYMPMTMGSSAFSASSSIYANTPRAEDRYNGGGLRGYSGGNGNNTTTYPGASDFERAIMLQSSFWDGSQPARGNYTQTPPGGQGG